MVGALLLLATPSKAFGVLVPWLPLLATAVFALGSRLKSAEGKRWLSLIDIKIAQGAYSRPWLPPDRLNREQRVRQVFDHGIADECLGRPTIRCVASLVGMLCGEQLIPVGRQFLSGSPFVAAWTRSHSGAHIFGDLPGRPSLSGAAPNNARVRILEIGQARADPQKALDVHAL
jgi:xanthosine utilization system XapX-like protein